ncbi:MAG: nitrate/sulfonate/bicarbonate ABC transporter, partial [Thioalkalivibrio sp.]
GLFGALDYLAREPADAVKRMAPRVNMEPGAFQQALGELRLPDRNHNRELLGGDPSPLGTTLTGIMEIMLEEGLLDEPVNIHRLIRAEPLTAVARRSGG